MNLDDTPIRPPDDSRRAQETVELPPRSGSRRFLWIASGTGAALLCLVGWLVVAKLAPYLTTPADIGGGPPADTPAARTETRKIAATLYYVSDDGMELVPLAREVAYGATPAEQARHVVEAQVQPPPEGWASAIPAGTTVRAVFLTATGDAYVDLGGALVTGHTGGSLDEALAVYAIVNAVTTNLPDVTAVQILIEGKEVETLRGHLDLRYPLAKSLDWVKKGQ